MKSPKVPKANTAHTPSTDRPGQPSRPQQAPDHLGSFPVGKRILLVDDDPTVRDSLNDLLVAEGYSVVPAQNGERALFLARNSAVDLVLLDLNMPVMNGWDTFERLTAEHPLIPVIIVTARPNQLFMALNAGVGALLEKPMDIPALLQTIRNLLAESAELRLARLAGKSAAFCYKPATPDCATHRAARLL